MSLPRVAILALVLGFVSPVLAQQAPTGAHYGGRATDTGYSGGVSSGGQFSAAVPLELPPARGGLPVPIEIQYTGHGVGAAGLGWDMPPSYVRKTSSFVRRRPAMWPAAAAMGREQLVVVLAGRSLEMVHRANTREWYARRDAPQLMLTEELDGSWTLVDGEARTFRFAQQAITGLWLLKSISAPANANRVDFTYEVATQNLPGGVGTSIDLTLVSYNQHPTLGCAKHEIVLGYNPLAPTPIALTAMGSEFLVRRRTLSVVEVRARATCGMAERIRRVELTYLDDVDTKLPRLHSARVLGRVTPEGDLPMPIGTYEYGTATASDGQLHYVKQPNLTLPGALAPSEIASTRKSATPVPDGLTASTMWQSLTDVTGDGRPDFMYKEGSQLKVFPNRPGAPGVTTFGPSAVLSDAMLTDRPLSTSSATHLRFNYGLEFNRDQVWRKQIDVNGDGRLDLIDASEQPETWMVYLNTPDPNAASGVKWEKRSWKVSRLRVHLGVLGHSLPGGFVPLERRYTGRDQDIVVCWKVQNGQWLPHPQGWPTSDCPQASAVVGVSSERTYTEWDLDDLNGDGYPDFVLNSSMVQAMPFGVPPAELPGAVLNSVIHYEPHPRDRFLNQLDVYWNVVGPRFDLVADPFSEKEHLGVIGPCGIGLWLEAGLYDRELHCGLVDVNGDGVADRISNGQWVQLGTGRGFSSEVLFKLPATIRQQSEHDIKCPAGANPQTHFDVTQLSGLRDLNGDGFPDFIDPKGVYFGTGFGFSPTPKPVEGLFVVSKSSENCAGEQSVTQYGLYDLDGDGKPEALQVFAGWLEVWQLTAGSVPRTPEAGRLVAIDNGFGARTQVTYGSAKDDASTPHQMASSEIVVTSVETTGLAPTRYAYGNAQLYLDGVADGFRFPGYGRTVTVEVPIAFGNKSTGSAKLTDTLPLAPFAFGDPTARFSRYEQVGRTRDETGLAGAVGDNAWALLTVDATNDPRRVGNVHTDWRTRYFQEAMPIGYSANDCFDLMIPYDYQTSAANNFGTAYGPCGARGFSYPAILTTWRGTEGPPSTANVQARTTAVFVDDYGRDLLVKAEGDLYRGDDDVCIVTFFGEPLDSALHRFDAPAYRLTNNCPNPPSVPEVIYAKERYEYDGEAVGFRVGRRTAVITEQRSTYDGTLQAERRVDFAYDAVGNLAEMTKERFSDGAVQSLFFDYDAFGLVPIETEVTATGLSSLIEAVEIDPLTLDVLSTTDANGTRWGTLYDAHGRPTRSTVTPPGGTLGVVGTVTYEGFDVGPRTITSKRFADPVPTASLPSAAGIVETTTLDALGRETRTERVLGASYGTETLVTQLVSYDLLGRVAFSADPFPKSQPEATAYGTSFFFEPDGSPTCAIRGRGPQALATTTDASVERFPACYQRSFVNHAETVIARDPDALQSGTPQFDVARIETRTALGRVVQRGTWKGLLPQEMVTFGHDRLGRLTAMSRFLDPLALVSPVNYGWRRDSFGSPLNETREESATRIYTYDDWGDLLETRWTDAGVERRVQNEYDARGRLTRSVERVNGVVDAATDNQYAYDTAQPVPPSGAPLPPSTYLVGRLTKATSPTGAVHLSYDPFGNVASQVFTTPAGAVYVEETARRYDGALAALKLRLPDTAYALEQADYTYDSADALRMVKYTGQTGPQVLYDAQLIDAFGRVRFAKYGTNSYEASHAETGRRLPIWEKVASPSGARVIDHLGYDAVMRETSVKLTKNGTGTGALTNLAYDAIGRLSTSTTTESGVTLYGNSFTYDPLGNITKLADSASQGDATVKHKIIGAVDRDRICLIHYGDTQPTTTTCNVTYDGSGNILQQQTRTGMRNLTYFGSGQVRTLDEGNAHATFRYDAFGALQELDVWGVGVTDTRQDRHYGEHIESHAGVLWRRLPGLATRKGSKGVWTFPFSDQRGMRFSVNEGGSVLQDVRYAAFGEASSSISQPGTPDYLSEQWNGGDALAAFGIVALGARLYDPVIGRFLSRDPLVIPRTAATTNPYAFAMNDPHNLSDPTGLDTTCAGGIGKECAYLDPVGWQQGVLLASLVAYRLGTVMGDKWDWYGLAKSGTSVQTAVDIVKETPEDKAAFDRRENGTIIWLQSFSMGIGDRALAWCIGCGGQDFRDGFGLAPETVDAGAYGLGRGLASGAAMAFKIPDFEVGPLERGVPTVKGPGRSAGRSTGSKCFVAGTLVAAERGLEPIEEVRLGDRVDAASALCADDHLPIDGVTVVLEVEDGSHIELVRTADWLARNGLGTGVGVVSLDEIGVSGQVRVASIAPAPIEQPGDGCLVTMTVTHMADEILELRFEDGTSLELTPTHPLFVEGEGWVRAGEMTVGQAVRSDGGPLRLEAVASQPGQRVYNFEVAREHRYKVSERRIWTHNQCWTKDLEEIIHLMERNGRAAFAHQARQLGPHASIGDVYHAANRMIADRSTQWVSKWDRHLMSERLDRLWASPTSSGLIHAFYKGLYGGL